MTAINVERIFPAIRCKRGDRAQQKKNWVLEIAIDGMSCVLGSTFRRMI